MGSAPSRGGAGGEDSPEARYLDRMETELLRGALPKGLEDEKAKKLKYELSWCLAKNDWYFTAGGRTQAGWACCSGLLAVSTSCFCLLRAIHMHPARCSTGGVVLGGLLSYMSGVSARAVAETGMAHCFPMNSGCLHDGELIASFSMATHLCTSKLFFSPMICRR